MQLNADISERYQILDAYKEYLNVAELKVNSFLSKIGWNAKETFKNEKETEQQTKNDLKIKKSKVSNGEYNYPDVYVPHGIKSCVMLDMGKISEILNIYPNIKSEKIPQNLENYQSTFTSQERLLIYEYVLKNTEIKKENYVNLNFNLASNAGTSVSENSFQDELALKRDLKRRRAKYRKPASRGYKQELNDTIEAQMDLYINHLKKEKEINNDQISHNYFNNKLIGDDLNKQNESHSKESFNKSIEKEYMKESYSKRSEKRSFNRYDDSSYDYSCQSYRNKSFYDRNNLNEIYDDHTKPSKRKNERFSDEFNTISTSYRDNNYKQSSDNESIESYKKSHKKKSKHKKKKHKHKTSDASDSDMDYKKRKHKHRH